jgi:hypothetical protein
MQAGRLSQGRYSRLDGRIYVLQWHRVPYSDDHGNTVASRRRSPRVPGPFDARRVGASGAHVRVMDLSVGGCLIESLHEEKVGERFTLEIELPQEGWISVQAETLYLKSGHELAVRFVDMSDEARRILQTVVRRLLAARRDEPSQGRAKR